MKTCALHNLGCKVNSYETQAMQQMMEEAGYEIIPFGEAKADVYIINTCSVTNIADHKSRQMLHRARKLNPNAVVVATGCYVESANDEIYNDIDLVIGNNEKSKLIELLAEFFKDEPVPINHSIKEATEFDEMSIENALEHTRAFVKIQDGCNQFCTYCIIPYVRGRIRSRKPYEVIAQLTKLAEHGCKEVVLTGIHLSSYGLDMPEEHVSLIDIIERAHDIVGIERIRLGSLEPLIVTEDFARRLSALPKICPHFHLSLQSGCDETLRRMNRRYSAAQYRAGVEILRKYFDNPAITTDVIVGFPMESEMEFEETYRFLTDIKFYEMHIFKYSRRKGTMADSMKGQITDKVKTERSAKLLELDRAISKEYREGYIGKRVKVLIEETVEINGIQYDTGYTDTYVKVGIKSDGTDKLHNTILDVKIVDIMEKEMVLGVAEI